jgi:hypothetical protein
MPAFRQVTEYKFVLTAIPVLNTRLPIENEGFRALAIYKKIKTDAIVIMIFLISVRRIYFSNLMFRHLSEK